ncbi:MAG TPA: energy-coupling factor transporter transmembrane component T [Syntrophomonadaceae bacterium]|nr:energy-coupling factor transporter transmembrane component T [Syntrophomonadaceae bacterium]
MFGNYQAKSNLFYLTNPAVMLGLLISWVFLVLLFQQPLYIISIFVLVNLTMIFSGNFSNLIRQLKYALPLIIIIILINLLFNQNGTTILGSINVFGWLLNFYEESLFYGFISAIKLLTIISAFNFYSLVIDPDEMLNLTRKLGYKISLIVNMSMRLFPLIAEDYGRIQAIQKHRSLVTVNPTTAEKIKDLVPTMSILLMNSLDRSLMTSESLYSRGFNSGNHTVYKQIKWHFTDALLMINIFLLVICALWVQMKGLGFYSYYPKISSFMQINYLVTYILSLLLAFPLLLNWSCKLWAKLN